GLRRARSSPYSARMAARSSRSVAIVGDGPAGTTLAALLARDGMRVALFARGRPSGLVVGEALVPGGTPILRGLGVEEEVRSYGVFKPGATFVQRDGETVAFSFAANAGRLPGYAFNVARDRFDATLLEACRRQGARVFPEPARLEVDPAAPDRVRLPAPAPAGALQPHGADPPELAADAASAGGA